MNKYLPYLLLVLLTVAGRVWSVPLIGEWNTHFSYNIANQVVASDKSLFVEAGGKLFSMDLNDSLLHTYTTLDGLSDQTVVKIGWSPTAKTLIIVYANGNIDLQTSGKIYNLSDFKTKAITADKTIQELRIFENTAFISTGAGLLVVDLLKREFSNGYFFSFGSAYTTCLDAVIWEDSMMVVTPNGFYVGNRNNNLQDASYWQFEDNLPTTKAKQIVRFQNRFYVLGENGSLFTGLPHQWTSFLNHSGVNSLSVQHNRLMVTADNATFLYDSQLNAIPVESGISKGVALDLPSNTLYRASGNRGVAKLNWNGSSYVLQKDSIMPEGPPVNTSWNALFNNGLYISTSGGRWTDRYFYEGELSMFDGESWSGLPDKQSMLDSIGFKPMDFINVAIDPRDASHFFITTWGDGLLEFQNNKFFKRYHPVNSPLKTVAPGRFCRVDGAIFDKEGNLWVLNSKYKDITGVVADSSLLILKPDGSWLKPYYSSMKASPTWNSILFTSNGQTWMNAARARYGISVLDNKGTLEDTSDDESKSYDSFMDQDGLLIDFFSILCITEDKNGTVWIGTDKGPILASGISRIFRSDYTFTRVKVPKNDGTNTADYLLNDIRINCIVVDGANRKWIGTEGQGLYLLSSDGLETIHHFDTKNSPLPSDVVWSIAIHPTTGEVFIGTESGLVSYRSDATEGMESYQSVHVFPNPVKPDFNGLITVTGLKANTQVRITDLTGITLIKGNSLGGQFSWNGITPQGSKASSGIYLVFCASEDGTEDQVCKFMIVR